MSNKNGRLKKIKGFTKGSMPFATWEEISDKAGGLTSALSAVMANPDLLSDEQALYHTRDFDAEEEREEQIKMFKLAYDTLTPRQKEVVKALDLGGTQEGAAALLNLSRTTIAMSLRQIQKKILKHIDKQQQVGYRMRGIL